MDPAAPELSYESRIPSALQAGESVLWERKPIAPEPLRLGSGIFTALAIIVGAGLFARLISHDTVATVFSTITAAAVIGMLALLTLNEALTRRRKQARSLYRITDRRIMRIDDTAKGACDQLPIVALACMEMAEQTRGASARFYAMLKPETATAVEFGGVETPQQIESLIISQWSAARRRATIRRTRTAANDRSMTTQTNQSEVALHPEEAVLWSGSPRVPSGRAELRRQQLIILAWMTVPIVVLASALGLFRPYVGPMPTVLIAAAILWIVISLNAMFIKPRRDTRRRARTLYVLTGARAIVREDGPSARRTTRSYFLDIAKDAWLTEHPDGTGDVGIDVGVTFERIANPADVYARVLQAIRTSGTIAATSCATASSS